MVSDFRAACIVRCGATRPAKGHGAPGSSGERGATTMTNTAIFILIGIVVIGGIFWLVIYSSRRGEKHRQRTTIKPPDSHQEGQGG